ncbi:glycosyltransferase [Flavobacterium sp. NST-5]|uniref:Glycosyltransferase n=1 Tax=Flavobacterium ichthyis TaxID=2698827 RepID=A0ABW9Z7H0_9FLAO|nr:glycosyltransferase family 4 protein [Flavobacterium ichthyis]NBL64818.1 glycosyltransferase [Flavobacterium ichthyis]
MPKVIYFTKYTKLGASSRLRSIQFFPFLEEQGFRITHQALFGNQYLSYLYKKSKLKLLYLFLGYVKRFLSLLFIFRYDFIVIEKELFPYFPAWIEIALNRLGKKYYVDYDDAIFHKYDLSRNPFIKKFLHDKIDIVMKNSQCVFAGNSYLAERAQKAGAKNIKLLPTVIDIGKYKKIDNKNKANFTLGWIGSPSTYKYVEKLLPTFYQLKESYPHFYVNIIGAKPYPDTIDFINYIPWSENQEVLEINKFDIGVMPLELSPWELGKCSYKLIQYMGCNVAVLASPVGMNVEVVQDNYNGFLVEDTAWFEFIEKYILDKNLTTIHGENGRQLVDTKFNIQVNLDTIIKEFQNQ